MISDRADTTACASVWEAPSCASEKHSSADIAVEKPGSSYQRLEGTNYTIEVHAPRATRTAPRAPRTRAPTPCTLSAHLHHPPRSLPLYCHTSHTSRMRLAS